IYAVREREIIDLTLRPGSSLSENPLCARFGAPRSMIRVVLQRRFVHPDTGKPMAFSLPLPAAAPWKEFLE
ncbi:hypothetical protein R2O95_14255, partial [Faecalibacterium duncaniae]|nr:hypothetical protein [Faecalibacterium duncaniae]